MHDVFAYVQQIAVNNDDNNSTSNASLVWDLAKLFTKPVHWRNSFLSLRFVDKQFSEISNSQEEICGKLIKWMLHYVNIISKLSSEIHCK